MTEFFLLLLMILNLTTVYFTQKLLTWSLVNFVFLSIFYTFFYVELNPLVFNIVSFIFIIISLCNIKILRSKIITKFIYKKAKLVLPKISETERLALNAGDPWFEEEIFKGEPDFNKLHNIKKYSLTAEEQSFLDNETNILCSMLDDWEITHKDRDLPVAVWDYLRKNKFFGLVIAKEYGGLGFSASAHSAIVMKIATKSSSAAVTVMVPNSLGPGELLYHYGTTEQKNHYLPKLVTGDEIPCFALTGPTAGSDATSIPDMGIVCYGTHNNQQVLGILLKNVNKRYITLAPIATCVGLAFQVKDPENLLRGIGREGITCALLPNTHKGLIIGNRLNPLDLAFMNGTVKIDEAFIPLDFVIGGQKMIGEGWRMLVECLSIGRSISLPACGVASNLLSTVTSSAYSVIREQFKVPIASFEGVSELIAKLAGSTYLLNATRQFTVLAVDSGVRPSVASAIAKYHLTEGGRVAINQAMDIHAGRAIIMGPNNYIAKTYQGIPVGITVEGANIMTRNLMIFGQGAMRCHPYIRAEYESLMIANGINQFDKALFAHIGYSIRNTVRSIFHSLTCGKFANTYKNSKFHNYYKQITRLSSNFAHLNDMSLVLLGGDIKRKERISARLGDVMSYLYMACASLKYYEDNNKRQSDELFLTWSLQHALHMAANSLDEVLSNYPLKIIARILRIFIFPYGNNFKKPSDKLEGLLAEDIISNSEMRQVFKNMCYVPDDNQDPVGRVEIAYLLALKANFIKRKINLAIKSGKLIKNSYKELIPDAIKLAIITNDEGEILLKSLIHTNEVIQVDEFDAYALGPKNAHPNWHA